MKKLILVFVALCICIGFVVLCVEAMRVPQPVWYEEYVVESGDTLWDIAKQSDMWNKMDAHQIIDDMQEKSNCSATIHPGQVVYIPMYND